MIFFEQFTLFSQRHLPPKVTVFYQTIMQPRADLPAGFVAEDLNKSKANKCSDLLLSKQTRFQSFVRKRIEDSCSFERILLTAII